MLDSGDVDAVVTTVPHYLHPEMAHRRAASAASTCWWRSRPASTPGRSSKLLDLAAAHPELTTAIMFNQRTNPLYQDLRELVAGGELGKLRHTSWIITTWWRPQGYYDQSALARHLGRRGRRRPGQPGTPPARPVAVDLRRAEVGVRQARLRLPARHRRRGRGDRCRRLRRRRHRDVHHLHPRPARHRPPGDPAGRRARSWSRTPRRSPITRLSAPEQELSEGMDMADVMRIFTGGADTSDLMTTTTDAPTSRAGASSTRP